MIPRHHWLRRNGLALAYTVILILLAAGAYRVEDTRRDDRRRVEHAIVLNCQSGNRVRAALRDFLDAVIAQSDKTRPSYPRAVELFEQFKTGAFADRDCSHAIDPDSEEALIP